ncbi:MAG: HAD-IIA family hydrolase [Acidimicrobiia bacterium]|nr:HAD-IIA family hydrolase [Acidimicrobiia bacterium]
MATVICDLDGVIYIDGTPIAGAATALEEMQRDGHQLLFVTNNATRHVDSIVAAIEESTGFRPAREAVLSSSMAAASMLEGRVSSAFVVGEAGLSATLAEWGISSVAAAEAESVVVGLDRALTYDKLRDATLAIRRGALFIATNLDSTYPTPTGLWPGGGALVAALTAASGRTPEVAGKPAEPIRKLLRSKIEHDDVWVIGDRPDTDLALGEAEGWKTALVLTGVTTDAGDVSPAPTAVIDSIADLPPLL